MYLFTVENTWNPKDFDRVGSDSKEKKCAGGLFAWERAQCVSEKESNCLTGSRLRNLRCKETRQGTWKIIKTTECY